MKAFFSKTMPMVFALLVLWPINLSSQKLNMDLLPGLKPRNIGPAGMSGRVTSIDVLLSDPSVIYLGSAAGGVWHTENNGDTWTALFTDQVVASIGVIKINQNNPAELWVGTGEGNPRNSQNSGYGIYKSMDHGKSWKLMGLENTRTIHRIIQHRDDPNTIVVAATGSAWGDSPHRGIYKTTDGGKTWRQTLFLNNRTGASDLVVDPNNPNKLYAGMWEYRRWPWFFKSGGVGSGIYVSHNAGETWEKRTHEDGLPEGELGRIGLSVAPTNSQMVYAYVESENNAIYRSEDGGKTWSQRSKNGDKKIGGRPFYYADIYVDTQNENRVYSIATEVTVTEDGGKTWNTYVPGDQVHTDHHAWWSHPDNNEFILLGHDGGANITYDRGKKWRFFDNLPLAQFYHVRVDNEIPYNVYGGLQDNGSWKGPSEVWFKGGIRNMYWQRLSIGDGFDMIPDPLDVNYGWSMGQKGNLFHYHTPSGQLRKVRPQHPSGVPLRFNWNAGIAVDPFEKSVVYYGSQFLLKSNNQGASWQVISPDLTTNDPAKQNQLQTGGLTYDNTGAENYTTIITVVPSELQQGLIWVGTDDGKVHVTRNGGEQWTEVTGNIRGVPANTWVPHIHVSNHDVGEAFVVFEDHRRDNWTPYLYRTKDYGRTWTRIIDEGDVWGFVYSFVQDTEAPNLYFCGTESGLYVSIDAGTSWSKWTNGYPTVPTSDMVIHPRDGDLIIGTFGRAFWILDDLTPLRKLASQGLSILNQDLLVFPPPDAYLVNIGESFGYRKGKVGDALFEGENRPYGALITYYLPKVIDSGNDKDPLTDSVRVEVWQGETLLRTSFQSPREGINRINWKLDRDAVRYPHQKAPTAKEAPKSGVKVAPGVYQIAISYKDLSASTEVTVLPDPRLNVNPQDLSQKENHIKTHLQTVAWATQAADQLREVIGNVTFINSKLNEDKDTVLLDRGKAVIDSAKGILDTIFPPEKTQGIYRDASLVGSKLQEASYLMDSPLVPWTINQELAVNTAHTAVQELIRRTNGFMRDTWKPYQQEILKKDSLLVPNFEALSSD